MYFPGGRALLIRSNSARIKSYSLKEGAVNSLKSGGGVIRFNAIMVGKLLHSSVNTLAIRLYSYNYDYNTDTFRAI
jgi:hypothetical protein